MALLKCPDCEKMISDRVDSCPFCGCPRKFFDLNIRETQSTKKEECEEKKIEFLFPNKKIEYPEELSKFAKRFGVHMCLAEDIVNKLSQIYEETSDIENILRKIPGIVTEAVAISLDETANFLFGLGKNITIEQLFDKYQSKYILDFNVECENIYEKYAEICDLREEFQQIRNQEKANRGRWEGGGFGIKGALKGAVSAAALNAGSDFLHSFGDRSKERKANNIIREKLDRLYCDQDTKKEICDAARKCIYNVFLLERDELLEIGYYEEMYNVDIDQAETIYISISRYAKSETEKIDNIIKCIEKYPAEKKYYFEILNSLLDYTESLEAFWRFWGIENIMNSVLNQINKEKEKRAIEESIKVKGGFAEYNIQNFIKTLDAILLCMEENGIEKYKGSYVEEVADLYIENFIQKENFNERIEFLEYIGKDKGLDEFIDKLYRYHEIIDLTVFEIMKFRGTIGEEDLNEKAKILSEGYNIILYYDSDLLFTDKFIMDLKSYQYMWLDQILKVEENNGVLRISSSQERFDFQLPDEIEIKFVENFIIFILTKYFGNSRLLDTNFDVEESSVALCQESEKEKKTLEAKIKIVKYGEDDWRCKMAESSKINIFSKRFEAIVEDSELKKYYINKKYDEIQDEEIKKKLNFFHENFPDQKILYLQDNLIMISEQFLSIKKVMSIDEITDIKVRENIQGCKLIMSDKDQQWETILKVGDIDLYLIGCIRYALELSETIEEGIATGYLFDYTEIEKDIANNFDMSLWEDAIKHYQNKLRLNIEDTKKKVLEIFAKAPLILSIGKANRKEYIEQLYILQDECTIGDKNGFVQLRNNGISIIIVDAPNKSKFIPISQIKKVSLLQGGRIDEFQLSIKGQFLLESIATRRNAEWRDKIDLLLKGKIFPKEKSIVETSQYKKAYDEIEVYIALHFDEKTKIKAIKWYCDKTGVDLKGGKEAVDKIFENAKEIKELEDEKGKNEIAISKENNEMEYINCPHCSKKINKTVKFCNFCGGKIEDTLICKNCGKVISSNAKFCNFCGQRTKEE